MSKILIATWPFPGHIFPQIALAHALRRRGHEPAFYTGNRAARVLESEKLRHFPFRSLDEDRLYETVFNPRRGSLELLGLLQMHHTLKEWLLGTVPDQVSDLRQVIDDWKPACILSDPTMWAPILILQEKISIPVAISSFVPACAIPGFDSPPFGPGLARPDTLIRKLRAKLAEVGSGAFRVSFRSRANAIRRQHGLSEISGSVAAHTATAALYLVPCSPEFDYSRRDLPANVHYVGPCLWNSPRFESEAWLDDVPRDRPWIHVTEGTVHTGEPFLLRNAALGLGSLPIWLIMTTGSDRDPAELGLSSLSPNVVVGRWVSHASLLPRVDCIVTTGGAGTVLAALQAGVPLIIVPTEWDKPEIAQRVVEAGAGIRVKPRSCTPARLRAAVERILGDSSFRKRAMKMSREFSRLGGPDRAAELVEQYLLAGRH